ncbi:double-strand-break repair protein rad21 homolog [Oppia nitens]|uniref:double-strand-break repair protein rad21 homolog n=1 Tax=Oppia nitens TaxID=1686743 RepID=UPI0023DB663B|nr:double-strand-break repair protein rad21 homolog [Oppia nitens]
MFYSVFVLGKKGPLARVWLAAHWDKKITKAQILETNIVESVDSILQPKVKLSLRTSSHLLLGIVRIYARKTLYLLQDCQDAAFKIKSAFRPGAVDLPDGKTEAAISAITLPEMLDFINDFDLIAEAPMQLEAPATSANIRSITLVEDPSSIRVDDPLMQDVRDWSDMSSIHASDGTFNLKDSTSERLLGKNGAKSALDLFDRPALDDGFGGELGVGIVDDEDMFGIPVPPEAMEQQQQLMQTDQQQEVPEQQPRSVQRPESAMSDRSDSMSFGAPASMAPSGPPSTPGSVPPMIDDDEDMPFAPPPPPPPPEPTQQKQPFEAIRREGSDAHKISDIHDTMVLEPLEAPGLERRRKRRKKLGMLIDEVKTLSGEEMKAQLSDTTDIITTLDLAPPSKKLMHWKRTGTAEKMFSLPERLMPCARLIVLYSRHLITSRVEAESEEYLPEGELVNGHDPSAHAPLPELEDLEQELPQLSPIAEPPKTPKTPSYTRSPAKKKRKTTDRPKTPTPAVTTTNHVAREDVEQPEPQQEDQDSRLRDVSSIQDLRAGSLQTSEPFQQPFDTFQDEDDDDDYGAPMSVGPPEPMFEGETEEQFEERITKRRTDILLKYMVSQLEVAPIHFTTLVKHNRRKQVAQKFFSLLVLKKQQAIELTQDPDIPYAEIYIGKGRRYEESLMSSSVS